MLHLFFNYSIILIHIKCPGLLFLFFKEPKSHLRLPKDNKDNRLSPNNNFFFWSRKYLFTHSPRNITQVKSSTRYEILCLFFLKPKCNDIKKKKKIRPECYPLENSPRCLNLRHLHSQERIFLSHQFDQSPIKDALLTNPSSSN